MELFARLFRGKKNKHPRWQEIEYFNESWKTRIKAMAAHVPPGTTVMDLGSGKEWLRGFLPKDCKYLAVDYKDRGSQNLVCDFNKHEFPTAAADVAFISGCLEYVQDFEWFIERVCATVVTAIVSYNTVELVPDKKERRSLAWKNDLSEDTLVSLFIKHNMRLDRIDRSVGKNPVFIFRRQG